MSSLSGFDSEAVGFDSVSQSRRRQTTTSSQTTEFEESGVGSQTALSIACGSLATPEELNAGDDVLKEYPPPGLNEFLRRVVPGVLEQLDRNEREVQPSSEEEDEPLQAHLLHELDVHADAADVGSGDHEASPILSLSWSSGGGHLAVGSGHAHHEQWCAHAGRLRVYAAAGTALACHRSTGDGGCVTVVKYHPSVAALLAYGTSSGEVVVCSLREEEPLPAPPDAHGARARVYQLVKYHPSVAALLAYGTSSGEVVVCSLREEEPLPAPPDAHGARALAALEWAPPPLANTWLTTHIQNTGRRRGASDQILISAGADGTVKAWQVNVSLKTLELVASFSVQDGGVPADVTCLDVVKSYPLRPCDEKVAEDQFVVGTSMGSLTVLSARGSPARALRPLPGAALAVAFGAKPGVLAALASLELRLYHVDQLSPLKVICLDEPASCLCWAGRALALGGAGGARLLAPNLRLRLPARHHAVTAMAAASDGSYRLACGDAAGMLQIWEIPSRLQHSSFGLDF